MPVRIGYDIALTIAAPVALLCRLRVHPLRRLDLLAPELIDIWLALPVVWNQLAQPPKGRSCVPAVCDFVHRHIKFDGRTARATRTATDGFRERLDVRRDDTHFAVTLCRCTNIPAGDVSITMAFGQNTLTRFDVVTHEVDAQGAAV